MIIVKLFKLALWFGCWFFLGFLACCGIAAMFSLVAVNLVLAVVIFVLALGFIVEFAFGDIDA